ncbi:hyaluronidase-1-like [Saccostrea echinata]|uniref:hyaluronidase-1-like n=1 Tax=Saccostrea echinata TaxID=191078 RepID=UPI002A82A5DB|nr:hyaluronidase-1-like [Saccostrea echinata]
MYETLIITLIYISFLFFVSKLTEENQKFTVVWNVPSEICYKKYNIDLNLSNFRIITNKDTSFRGEEIVLFYEPLPGLYPKYFTNGSALNGGIPQKVPFKEHLRKAAEDIEVLVPSKHFDGKGVIDWESWRPIYERNSYEPDKLIYMKESKKLVQTLHPTWNSSMVDKMAKQMFEESARELMENTLRKAIELRPNGLWGFYGFPRCFNYEIDEGSCQNDTIHYNDQLKWLFSASTALYPSIYLSSKFPSSSSRQKRVQGILNETLRVRAHYSTINTPIYSYSTYRFTDTNKFYLVEDLITTVGQSFDAGMDGVLLWDTSKNFKTQENCESLQEYIKSTFGPLVKSIVDFAEKCSAVLCKGHGKCVRNSWISTSGLQVLTQRKVFEFENYKCRCISGWEGTHCEKPINIF